MISANNISIKIGSKNVRPIHVSLIQDVNDHHRFTIDCDAHILGDENGRIAPEDVYDWIGKDVMITIKSNENANDKLEFKGIVTQIELGKRRRNYDTISLIGKSDTTLIDDHRDVVTFSYSTITDIAKKVLDPLSNILKTNISGNTTIPYCTQYRETAFDFISRLAFKYGLWFYYDGKKLRLGDYETTNSYNLKLGPEMENYFMSLTMFPVNFGLQHYHYPEDKHYVVQSDEIPGPNMDNYGQTALDGSIGIYTNKHKNLFTESFEKESNLKDFAKNRFHSTAAQMMMLYGDSKNPGIHIGTKIDLKDQEDNNAGAYYITQVSHNCDEQGNYSNSFQAIPAALKNAPPNAHVRLPKANAQIAIVKENGDPDRFGRVKVQFPWQDQNETSPWIRVVYPYAGNGDMYFVPEVDDQVMIGFEFDNPDRPFVMGSVYHGKLPPQYASDNNSIKAIHTKCGHRIIFEDGDDSMISIITKEDKNSIVLSLNDDGEINITTEGVLNFKGKTINIEGDELNIKMDSAINIEAGQDLVAKGANLELTADQSASIKGTQATMEGQTEVGISGAQAKVEGSATTTIKGGIVQIN